jgi:histone H3/H4
VKGHLISFQGRNQMSDSNEVLVVVSKLKNYIKNSADMNCSGNVPARLTEIVQKLCDDAVANAKKDGRKTVMDRDFNTTTAYQNAA